MKEIILTGIKPTGTVHIGNYFGAIKPAIDLSNKVNSSCFYFIADYHALTTVHSAKELKEHTYEVASTWLACGLDPNKVVLYKQSDIAEIFELTTIINNVTPKGLMNRAHAYKAMVDQNIKNNIDVDSNVNMGLYNYPILMTSDILIFDTKYVPVGIDQKQHVEIARDIVNYFNKAYGDTLVLPTPYIKEEVKVIPGLDGRKMSKSYGNTIKLFADDKELKKTINRIVTDSKGVDEPKGTDNTIYSYYSLFATKDQLKEFEQQLKNGIGWGQAKQQLYELIKTYLAPMKEKYDYYMSNKHLLDEILENGANVAREIAKQTLNRVKIAIGTK